MKRRCATLNAAPWNGPTRRAASCCPRCWLFSGGKSLDLKWFEYFGGILYLSIYIHYRIYQSYLFPSPNYHVWDNINQHYVPLHSWTLLNHVVYNRCLLHGSMKVNRCLALPKPRGLSARDILFEYYSMCFLCLDYLILAVAFGLPFLGPCFPSELFADVTSWAPLFDNIVTTR